jgi:hypothetical protein
MKNTVPLRHFELNTVSFILFPQPKLKLTDPSSIFQPPSAKARSLAASKSVLVSKRTFVASLAERSDARYRTASQAAAEFLGWLPGAARSPNRTCHRATYIEPTTGFSIGGSAGLFLIVPYRT